MVPYIHDRGSSFKEATNYILHDRNAQTSHRVTWTHTVNLGGIGPADAWRVMYETWDNRTALKIAAGVDRRGRDNDRPVLHYTLSWRPGEQPDREHMIETALSSLKALKIEAHQALMAAHNDTEHPHVHIIVNTVHPETGRTAPLKFSARTLIEWAKEYEREHGFERPPPKPAMRKHDRVIYNEHILARVKRHNAEIAHRQLVERDVTWAGHRLQQQALQQDARNAGEVALEFVRDRFKSRWRDLFEAQRQEFAHLSRIQDKPIERAAFVIQNSERLGNGAPLSMKAKAELIQSPSKLFQAVEKLHARERRMLSNVQKVEAKYRLDRVWQAYEIRFAELRQRQSAERDAQRSEQKEAAHHPITFGTALHDLIKERRGDAPVRTAARAAPNENDVEYVYRIKDETRAFYERNAGPEALERMRANDPTHPPQVVDFNEAAKKPSEPYSRADKVARDMAEWRAKYANKDMDFDRER